MRARAAGWYAGALMLAVVAGCTYPVREETDMMVCDLVNHPADTAAPATPPESSSATPSGTAGQPGSGNQSPAPPGQSQLLQKLQYPQALPGGTAPPLNLPPVPGENDPNAAEKRRLRAAAVDRYFPPLPTVAPVPQPPPGPEGRPLTLGDLERIGLANSPLIQQAASDVAAARGAAIQAGAYPNPNFGYEGDTAGTGGTAGYQGAFVEQTIRTAGKIKLAQAAATMDLRNAELALRKARADLLANIRSAYFSLLVARETMRVNQLLAEFGDRAYGIQVLQLKAGIAAVYEPMQLRVLAYQSRAALLQARNAYTAAWKALASTIGRPDMPLTQVAGQLDRMTPPEFNYDTVLSRVLGNHTDVQTANFGIRKARYNLLAAQVTPIPDANLHVAVQKDYTTDPHTIVTTVSVGAAIPIWDQNKGAIIQAQGALRRAIEEPHRVRDDLTSQVADAFNRYQTNVMTLTLYRDKILPDQVRAYQQLRIRYNLTTGDVGFGDIVTAQQTLGTLIGTYLTTLTAEWTAVVDLSHLLQTDEMFDHVEMSAPGCSPLDDLEKLLALPCDHPCNPLPTPTPVGVNPAWPTPPEGHEQKTPAAEVDTLPLPPPRKVSQAAPGGPPQLMFE